MSYYNRCKKTLIKRQQNNDVQRNTNPEDIGVPLNYNIEVFISGLDTPIGIDFTDSGDMLIADCGIISNNPKVLILINGQLHQVANVFNTPITGITYRNDIVYVTHRGTITAVSLNGIKQDILKGLPSHGDYSNNKVSFGPDGKMYFGQGTATNSGVVGHDNDWIFKHPYFHDYAGSYIMFNGQNYPTQNIFSVADNDVAYTGAFLPYGTPYSQRYYTVQGIEKATGSLLKVNIDGSELEQVAWGFRNPFTVKFDLNGRLFVANQGYDERGSRPIANAPDELQLVIPMTWYGWPDYAGGEPVTLSQFSNNGSYNLEFLFANHPSIPPRPFTTFQPNANIMGFDFNDNPNFGRIGDIYIAEFGNNDLSPGVGHRVHRVNISNGNRETFAFNTSNVTAFINEDGSQSNGGFSKLSDIIFGPDGAMYIVDMGIITQNNREILPFTGVIWRVSRN